MMPQFECLAFVNSVASNIESLDANNLYWFGSLGPF